MSRVVMAPPGYSLGDGTTAGRVASDRWRRWRWMIGVGTLAVVVVVGLALVRTPESTQPLSIANHQPNGARAVAEVLRGQGVAVTEVDTLQSAYARLLGGGTLAIANYEFLSDEQVDSIMTHRGEIVWLAPEASALEAISPTFTTDEREPSVVRARCDAPHAVRADVLVDTEPTINVGVRDATVDVCFSTDNNFSGPYVRMTRVAAGDVHLIADPGIVANGSLDSADGRAALAFASLGGSDTLVWYSARPFDQTLFSDDQGGASYVEPLAPEWLTPMLVAGALVVLMGAAWRGRRMGALVTEPLPVIVRASEATRGRARLYRGGRSTGHAAAAMRAGAASRMAARLGLQPSSAPESLVAAIASATGRDAASIQAMLYGPGPRDESQMLHLVRQLDELEGEVAKS